MNALKPARWTMSAAILVACALPASALNLPFGIGSIGGGEARHQREAPAPAPVILAQSSDLGGRVGTLEEENRRLNGRVEELSFQLLQLQEQLRKTQEDNEYRFQELEGGAKTGEKRTETAAPSGEAAGAGAQNAAASPRADLGARQAASAAPAGETTEAPPAGGDPVGDLLGESTTESGTPAGPSAPAAAAGGSDTVATLTPNSPAELYDLAYNYLLAGDYQLAENSFRQYSQAYPDAKDTPDAEYWLGESLYAQAKYTDAAEVFLNAQKKHPKSGKAPDMMLKLGMSLAKLDNRDTACVTFKEVARRYPQMGANVKRKLAAEQAAASC